MNNSQPSENLFSSFPPASIEDWLTKAKEELNGKNPLEALEWNAKGMSGQPYYDKSSTSGSFQLSKSSHPYMGARAWYNMPLINGLYEKSANEKTLTHLQNGADGIVFDLRKNKSIQLTGLLNNIDWTACAVSFYLPEEETFFKNLFSYLDGKKNNPESIHGFFLSDTYPHHQQVLHNVIHRLNGYSNFRVLGITSQLENPVDLACDLLTKAVATIDQFATESLDTKTIIRNIFFSIPIENDFFIEIAKLKAIRYLWHQVANAYHAGSFKSFDLMIHAQCKPWKNDSFAPHENMFKNTTASMAAILGGCNALTTEPDDENDLMLDRVARNISNVLREESHLNKVADPTAGSYYLDSLVNTIIHQAGEKFKATASRG